MRALAALAALLAPAAALWLALWLLLALALLALSAADVLWFVLLHAELPDECLGAGAGYWLCY